MTVKSVLFCVIVVGLKVGSRAIVIPRLAALRSNDLVILYAIVILTGMCVVAAALGLTPALGALAAGVILGENRLTHQIDSLVLPFREAFSAVFFISLGMMTDFNYVFQHPLLCFAALFGAIVFKAFCATFALRVCGMDRRSAIAYGVSISQIGELAFMLLSVAYFARAIDDETYNTMLFVAVASLVLTPNMVKIAMQNSARSPKTSRSARRTREFRRSLSARSLTLPDTRSSSGRAPSVKRSRTRSLPPNVRSASSTSIPSIFRRSPRTTCRPSQETARTPRFSAARGSGTRTSSSLRFRATNSRSTSLRRSAASILPPRSPRERDIAPTFRS